MNMKQAAAQLQKALNNLVHAGPNRGAHKGAAKKAAPRRAAKASRKARSPRAR